MAIIGIYKITCTKNKKIYIGQSVDIKRRWVQHKKVTDKTTSKLNNSIKKYGEENHNFEILTECEISELNKLERYYQQLFNCIGDYGMNCKVTKNEGKSGYFSDEVKQKMSKAKIGYKNIMFGKTHSAPARKKISETHKGRVLTNEHKYNISKNHSRWNKGIPMNEEQKELRRKLFTGRKMCDSTKIKIRETMSVKTVLDFNTGIYYSSCNEASKAININKNTLFNYLSGTRKNKTSMEYV